LLKSLHRIKNGYIFVPTNKLKHKTMTTIETTTINNDTYTIEFNGSATYFVSNEFDCIGKFSTLRKAKNFLKKVQG